MATVVSKAPLDSTLALIDRARAGDRAAIELIAERYRDALVRFAHGRVPVSARGMLDTQDLVQVALMRTLQRLDAIDSRLSGSLLAYLRRAVLNQILDESRNAGRRPRLVSLNGEPPGLDRDPLDALISREEHDRYEVALSRLAADQQEAFILRVEMDCSYAEIAEALGRTSAEAARMLVRRAIRTLVKLLRHRERT